MFAETSRGRLSGAEAAMVGGPGCLSAAGGPLGLLLFPQPSGALPFQPHPLGDRQSRNTEVNMHIRLLAKRSPLVQLGAPPSRIPHLAHRTHPRCLPRPRSGSPPFLPAHTILHKGRAVGKDCTREREPQATRILWARERARQLLAVSEGSFLPVTLCQKKKKTLWRHHSGLHSRHAELERVLERELGEGREGIPGPIVSVSATPNEDAQGICSPQLG